MAEEIDKLRIDKYLWSIRIFKTRSLASQACKAGKVKLNGTNVKPSALVRVGEVYTVQKGIERKTIKVLSLIEKRVGAKEAVLHYEDLTPKEDTAQFKNKFHAPALQRERGTGRPTKKERREIDALQDFWWDEDE